jgi:hypothetical protein
MGIRRDSGPLQTFTNFLRYSEARAGIRAGANAFDTAAADVAAALDNDGNHSYDGDSNDVAAAATAATFNRVRRIQEEGEEKERSGAYGRNKGPSRRESVEAEMGETDEHNYRANINSNSSRNVNSSNSNSNNRSNTKNKNPRFVPLRATSEKLIDAEEARPDSGKDSGDTSA